MAKEKSDKTPKDVSQKVLEDIEMLDGAAEKVSICFRSRFPLNGSLLQSRKSKKVKEEIIIPLEDLSPIAHPLAQKKLAKKLHKTIKRGLWFAHLLELPDQCVLQPPKLDKSNVVSRKLSKASGKERLGKCLEFLHPLQAF
jgi:hypothetical protein